MPDGKGQADATGRPTRRPEPGGHRPHGAPRAGGGRQRPTDTRLQVSLCETYATCQIRRGASPAFVVDAGHGRAERRLYAAVRDRSGRLRGAAPDGDSRSGVRSRAPSAASSRRFRATEPASVCPSGVACGLRLVAALSGPSSGCCSAVVPPSPRPASGSVWRPIFGLAPWPPGPLRMDENRVSKPGGSIAIADERVLTAPPRWTDRRTWLPM
jgi:hypothetical protein